VIYNPCAGCANYVNCGPNIVPYGEGWVNSGDIYDCRYGYSGPEECGDLAAFDDEPTMLFRAKRKPKDE
jgi:hypothetical protein